MSFDWRYENQCLREKLSEDKKKSVLKEFELENEINALTFMVECLNAKIQRLEALSAYPKVVILKEETVQ